MRALLGFKMGGSNGANSSVFFFFFFIFIFMFFHLFINTKYEGEDIILGIGKRI